jgi:hypothetical protein
LEPEKESTVSEFPEIDAKIAEYQRTHDETHVVDGYRPWECDRRCSGCERESGIRAALACAWRWVRDQTTSEDEAGEMVIECLKELKTPLVTLDDVENEATK